MTGSGAGYAVAVELGRWSWPARDVGYAVVWRWWAGAIGQGVGYVVAVEWGPTVVSGLGIGYAVASGRRS